MRKIDDGEKKEKEKHEKKKKIVATNVVASRRQTATDCNADRSCQYKVNFANTERLKKIEYYIHAKPIQ